MPGSLWDSDNYLQRGGSTIERDSKWVIFNRLFSTNSLQFEGTEQGKGWAKAHYTYALCTNSISDRLIITKESVKETTQIEDGRKGFSSSFAKGRVVTIGSLQVPSDASRFLLQRGCTWPRHHIIDLRPDKMSSIGQEVHVCDVSKLNRAKFITNSKAKSEITLANCFPGTKDPFAFPEGTKGTFYCHLQPGAQHCPPNCDFAYAKVPHIFTRVQTLDFREPWIVPLYNIMRYKNWGTDTHALGRGRSGG
ncbi:hypothetical protein BDZ97DRAFT_1996540 [Flammula alnicola]|nr:hypothetical protein BDZ97DRAFT_1996540 [Flammula alnicola]